MDNQTITVWDPLVRIFHWGLAVSFTIAWLTAESWDDLHEWAGYAAALLIGIRLIWGVIGSPYARFGQFVRTPSSVLSFSKAMLRGQEQRYIGHNPLGSLMILGLITAIIVTAGTGWMYTLDAFWGEEWVEQLHEVTANVMLFMVIVHVAGVVHASRRHHENLAKAMITGEKRSPAGDDIT